MKKLYILLALIIPLIAVTGCSEDEETTEIRWKMGTEFNQGTVSGIAWEADGEKDQEWEEEVLETAGDTTDFKEVNELTGQGTALLDDSTEATLTVDGEETISLNEGSSETLEFEDAI